MTTKQKKYHFHHDDDDGVFVGSWSLLSPTGIGGPNVNVGSRGIGEFGGRGGIGGRLYMSGRLGRFGGWILLLIILFTFQKNKIFIIDINPLGRKKIFPASCWYPPRMITTRLTSRTRTRVVGECFEWLVRPDRRWWSLGQRQLFSFQY